MLPTSYPGFHPQDSGKHTLSLECDVGRMDVGLDCIVPARRFSAISVWQPRFDPTQRLSSRLKRFNTAFLNLNDSTSFADGNVLNVLTLNPTFLSPSLRDQVLSSWDKFLVIIDDLHQGKLDFANHTLYHVSRVGLLKPVVAEVFAIRRTNRELLEFIVIETLVDSTRHLQQERAHATKVYRDCYFKWVNLQKDDLLWHTVEIDVHRECRKSKPFICAMCGLTKTTQRRYVLM